MMSRLFFCASICQPDRLITQPSLAVYYSYMRWVLQRIPTITNSRLCSQRCAKLYKFSNHSLKRSTISRASWLSLLYPFGDFIQMIHRLVRIPWSWCTHNFAKRGRNISFMRHMKRALACSWPFSPLFPFLHFMASASSAASAAAQLAALTSAVKELFATTFIGFTVATT